MQVLKAAELFSNNDYIDNSEFEYSNSIDIDFSDVNSIDLKDINILLNLQKVAIMNKKKLFISNVNSRIRQILDLTGLNKTCVGETATNLIKG